MASVSHAMMLARTDYGGNDANTHLLLHFNGSDGGTTFTDSSANNYTFTASGNAVTHTTSFAAPKFGTASGKFDGTTDFIYCSDAANLRPGTGDFTVDVWVRYNAGSAFQTIYSKGYVAAGGLLIQSDNSASPKIVVYAAGVTVVTETTGSSTGVWIHKAIVRSGSSVKIYSDGVANGSGTNSTDFNSTDFASIGAKQSDGSFSVNGNLDEFRYSNVARWTTAFNPPSAPYY